MPSDRQKVLQTRRDFIRQAACAAVGTTALTNTINDLRIINAAMANTTAGDYKAMVCVFLAGGNDANNLIVPTDPTSYNDYVTARSSVLALQQSVLQANNLQKQDGSDYVDDDGHTYGFHPALAGIRNLFNQGKVAMMMNVGTLVFPLTKATYNANVVKRPPQLFSHSDQVTHWQTSLPDQPPLTGWGGRCADLLDSVNQSNGGKISLAVSLVGANTYEVGSQTSFYSVSSNGAVSLTLPGTSAQQTARQTAMQSLLGLNKMDNNMQLRAYSSVLDHAIGTGVDLNSAINDSSNNQAFTYLNTNATTTFPTITRLDGTTTGTNATLMTQLRMVARMIEAGSRSTAKGGLGMKRQIFFVQIGGYDTHTNQVSVADTTLGSHSNLLAELSQSITAFFNSLVQIGALGGGSNPEQAGMENRVTIFTASDFCRTLQSNGQGSDHGWGGHHMIVGGAVNPDQSKRVYGHLPKLVVGGPDDTSTGRWIPTMAVDQYASTLAQWFGTDHSGSTPVRLISDSDLRNTIFPNLGRFSAPPTFL